ncbi:MAG: S41 family peptidase, partial [Bacteroidota bacterium]
SENPDLIPGSEVLALNGNNMEEILEQMFAFTSSDGYTKHWASYYLQEIFAYRFRFLLDESDQFELQLKPPNGLVRDFTLRGLSPKQMDSLRHQRKLPARKAEPSIQLSWNEELHTAILRILRFENWKEEGKKVDFLKFLKQSMKEIIDSGAKNLILDVGDRGGGDEAYGLEILSYLIDQPFTGYTAIEFANKTFKSRKYSETSKLEMALYKTLMRFQKTDSSYLLKNYKVLKPVAPKALHFSGDVYVIASRSTASATSDFVAWVHALGLAPIIGEETGGGYYGNTSNWEFTISLPQTKIRLYVPLARYFTNVKADIPLGRGVIPDYQVTPTIEDILAGLDPQLEFVFELIKKNSQP